MTAGTGRSIDHVVVASRDLAGLALRYEALGFTLTPRATHPERMGTANRLAQFAGRNFIELLEVDRPAGIEKPDPAAVPPRFGFGAFNRDFLRRREGISLLVLASDDARADLAAWERAGLTTYAPFDFERRARLPDGQEVTVAFSLGFVSHASLPGLGFFVCQNRFPQYFWKPAFQRHANGAQGIAAVYLAARDPAASGAALGAIAGGRIDAVDGGIRIACGAQELLVLRPEAIEAIAPGSRLGPAGGPLFAGLALAGDGTPRDVTPAAAAGGLFIDWR